MAAGNITIDLLMRTGSFSTDTARASKALRDFKRDAVDSITTASTVLLGLGGAAAGAFLALERGASAIAKFKDLGDVIGDTGEAVASLVPAADVSGVALETVTSASVKLTAALSKTDDEAKGAGAALAALNLPLEEFKRLSPVDQIDAVSKALAGFKDGAEKTAVAVALFGKAGAQLLPFLKELNEQGGPRVIITQDQIDAADKFSDSVGLLKSQVTQLGQSVLADLLPPFQAFVDEIGEADKALSIFSVAGSAVRIFFETITVLGANVIFVFKGIGTEIGGIAAQLAALARGDLKGFTAISDAMKADAAKARAELDRFEQRILGASTNAASNLALRRTEDRGFDPRKSIDTSGLVTDSTKGDTAKKLLDNQVKALEAVIRKEQDLLSERNRFLNLFNDQGLLSIRSYYDTQLAIIEASTSAQLAAIGKQIKLTEAARAKPGLKDTERADLSGKVDELIAKRAKVEQEAGSKAIELSIRREQAEKRFGQQIDATRASVLELQGNLSAAAAIRFDAQNQELIAKATAEGNAELKALLDTLRQATIEQAKFAEGADLRNLNASVLDLRGNLGAAAAIRFDEQNFALVQRLIAQGNAAGLELVKTLRQATIAQAEFGRASENTQRVTDALAISEDRISISRQLGATTELGALQQLGEARRSALVQLEAMVQAQEAIARASGNPALEQAAARARVELERLSAVADPLGDKFRSIFADAGTTGIETFINDVSRGKDAIKAFEDEVIRSLNRIISQNSSEAIFGKEGLLGGLVGSFGSLFGGQTSGGEAGSSAKAAADTSAAAATTSLAAAATAAAAALTQLSAGTAVSGGSSSAGTGGFWGGILDWFGSFFAEGGEPPLGKVSVGGERGRELFANTSASNVLRSVMYGPMPVRSGVRQVSGPTLLGADGNAEFFKPTVPGTVFTAKETEEILRNFGGAFAGGGRPPVGMTSFGGEEGRELFIPVTRGMQPPSNDDRAINRSRETGDTYISVPVSGQVDRRTRHQIANDIALEQRRAGRLA